MTSARSRDFLSSWRISAVAYGLPTAAIAIAGVLPIGDPTRAGVWSVACLAMAGACFANARRCGRVHCYFTGPFFLVVALVAALLGVGLVPPSASAWNVLGAVLVGGATLLIVLPERIVGKYRD
jgi:hypothetical protein